MTIDELELDALAQTGKQRWPVSGKNRLHNELVLVDESQICQRPGQGHASHPQASPGCCLSRCTAGPKSLRTSSAFQSTPLSVLDTTYFFA